MILLLENISFVISSIMHISEAMTGTIGTGLAS